MKLYFFEAGILRSDKGLFTANATGIKHDAPVQYFLIEHDQGLVLFDSGPNLEIFKDPLAAVGQVMCNAYNPDLKEENYVLNALSRAGIKPADIRYVICSHLHFDHSGGIGQFPKAKYLVQRQELHYAYVHEPFMKGGYFKKDFDQEVDWLFLEGWADNKYDVFDDRRLIIYFTPGHCPGHQSLLVNTEKNGSFLLAADACYTIENLEKYLLSGLSCDNSAYIKNLQVFNDLRSRGVKIVPGHDPIAWAGFKKYPEYYE